MVYLGFLHPEVEFPLIRLLQPVSWTFPMIQTRREFASEPLAPIARRRREDKRPISSIAPDLSFQPTQIHQWGAFAVEQVEWALEKMDVLCYWAGLDLDPR